MNKEKGIFLSVKDLMAIRGSEYESARKEHAHIRIVLCKKQKIKEGHRLSKRKLTIAEYCKYMDLEFAEIWRFLRPGENHPDVPEEKPE